MSKKPIYRMEIWQDAMMVAAVYGEDPEQVTQDGWHYAMVYVQDGPVEIRRFPAPPPEEGAASEP